MILSNKRGLPRYLEETGAGSLPGIAGCWPSRSLVICGDAACVWDDLEAFGCRSDEGKGGVAKSGFDFMMVNRIGETFPGNVLHWYSNAPHLINKFKASRRQEYAGEFSEPKHTHSCQQGAMWCWPWDASGTSALGAALTGVGLGYKLIVLCGIPLDDGPHNGEPPWRKTKFATSEAASPKDGGPQKHWKKAIDIAFEGKVKSMSGRTREWLGAP